MTAMLFDALSTGVKTNLECSVLRKSRHSVSFKTSGSTFLGLYCNLYIRCSNILKTLIFHSLKASTETLCFDAQESKNFLIWYFKSFFNFLKFVFDGCSRNCGPFFRRFLSFKFSIIFKSPVITWLCVKSLNSELLQLHEIFS